MSDITLRSDVAITVVDGKGFLLQRAGDQNFTKLGRAFRHLMPLLKQGCTKEELVDFFQTFGFSEKDSDLKVNQIIVSLEEGGLLIGSTYTLQTEKKGDIKYETKAFNPLIENLSKILPLPLNDKNFLIISISVLFTISIIALWSLGFQFQAQSLDRMGILTLISIVLIWFLGHEIMHAIVARKLGVGVKGIGIKIANSSRLSIFLYCQLEEKDVVFDRDKHISILLAGPAFDLFMLGTISLIYLIFSVQSIIPQLLIMGAAMTFLSTSVITPSDVRHALTLASGSRLSRYKTSVLKAKILTMNMLLALFLVLAITMQVGNSLVP